MGLEQLYFPQGLVLLLDLEVNLPPHVVLFGLKVPLGHHEAILEVADALSEPLDLPVLLEEHLDELLDVDVFAELIMLGFVLELLQFAEPGHLEVLENLLLLDVLLEFFLELANELLVLLCGLLSDAQLLLQDFLALLSDLHALPESLVGGQVLLEKLDLILEFLLHQLVAHVPKSSLLVHAGLEMEDDLASLL